uniref:Putative ovule protein n=1 Tax=Solanum chacoense TaxID=4108 RepID=A0A0V0HDP0_SOLCH
MRHFCVYTRFLMTNRVRPCPRMESEIKVRIRRILGLLNSSLYCFNEIPNNLRQIKTLFSNLSNELSYLEGFYS